MKSFMIYYCYSVGYWKMKNLQINFLCLKYIGILLIIVLHFSFVPKWHPLMHMDDIGVYLY